MPTPSIELFVLDESHIEENLLESLSDHLCDLYCLGSFQYSIVWHVPSGNPMCVFSMDLEDYMNNDLDRVKIGQQAGEFLILNPVH